jgi:hypothetical protein
MTPRCGNPIRTGLSRRLHRGEVRTPGRSSTRSDWAPVSHGQVASVEVLICVGAFAAFVAVYEAIRRRSTGSGGRCPWPSRPPGSAPRARSTPPVGRAEGPLSVPLWHEPAGLAKSATAPAEGPVDGRANEAWSRSPCIGRVPGALSHEAFVPAELVVCVPDGGRERPASKRRGQSSRYRVDLQRRMGQHRQQLPTSFVHGRLGRPVRPRR